MPRELITLQAGQCGNQLGETFWNQISSEHGIHADGLVQPKDHASSEADSKEVFFYRSSHAKYTPRAVLIDLEPRVIGGILERGKNTFFNRENIHLAANGSGAGNNWALGYHQGQEVAGSILDMITREARDADSLEGFLLLHSIAGGTGSGFGSHVLEQILDHFPKKLIQTYSVFPGSEQVSNVVVQPYNSILALKRLSLIADSVIVLDNGALQSAIAAATATLPFSTTNNKNPFSSSSPSTTSPASSSPLPSTLLSNSDGDPAISTATSPSLDGMNKLAAKIMCTGTASLRFPSYQYDSLTSLVASLCPVPHAHFVTPSFTPIISQPHHSAARSSVPDTMRRLFQNDCRLVRASSSTHNARYLSVFTIFQGLASGTDSSEYHKSVQRLRLLDQVRFVPDHPNAIRIVSTRSSPYSMQPQTVSGLMLANETSISSILSDMLSAFDMLYKRKAFISEYTKQPIFADNFDEFVDSREVVKSVVDLYRDLEAD